LQTSVVAGSVEGDQPAVRAQYVDDAAATFVAEGAAIPEADPDLAEVVVHTGKVSQLIRLSREQFGQPNASTLLGESVRRAVTKVANAAYISQVHLGSNTQTVTVTVTGSPSGGTFTLSGNGATTGTIAYDAASATVQTAVRTLGGGFAAADRHRIGWWAVHGHCRCCRRHARPERRGSHWRDEPRRHGHTDRIGRHASARPHAGRQHRRRLLTDRHGYRSRCACHLQASIAANDGIPTHILLSPLAWASLRKFKDEASSARRLLGAGTENAIPSLPVIVSNAVPSGTGLMLDKTAIISAVGQVMVSQSEHIYFNSDSIGLRCTWRFGQNVVHPERLGSSASLRLRSRPRTVASASGSPSEHSESR